jgi:hypothetical protein
MFIWIRSTKEKQFLKKSHSSSLYKTLLPLFVRFVLLVLTAFTSFVGDGISQGRKRDPRQEKEGIPSEQEEARQLVR